MNSQQVPKEPKPAPENSPHLEEDASQWIRTEFEFLDLGDGRLNKRLKTVLHSFASCPNGSIPEASGAWSKTKAVYRLLGNEKVTPEKIFKPHQDKTAKRIAEEPVVLVINDTSTLDHTNHRETEGLGYIATSKRSRGMLVHTSLAITPQRVPLGIVHQQT